MKTKTTILAATVIAAALAGNAFAQSQKAQEGDKSWLSIPVVYEKVTAEGYTDITEIEREERAYEVKGRDAEGYRVKLYVDPVSGEILDTRSKGERGRKTK
ncbi:PepSY domain-containing protein [Marinobacter sp.]|uniref:PepSY domain-containing protein n=1 Tax=Marinobacter sp. TaxID=50741 RepID=UPI00356577D0